MSKLVALLLTLGLGFIEADGLQAQPIGGTVVGWGNDGWGQATAPTGLSNVTAIAAGASHTMALIKDGTVTAWGWNYFGQTNVPPGLSGVVAITAGWYHSAVLKSNGTVVAWGDNSSSQTNIPVGLNGVMAIAAGQSHTAALKTNGTVVAWGSGQTNVPAGLSNVVAIAAGGLHTIALKTDGSIVAWGDNSYGQTNIPTGLSNVIAIAAGNYHSVAVKANGTIVAWGWNYYNQTNVPAGLSNVTAVAAGGPHTAALISSGTVAAWGANDSGQTNVPAGLSNAVAVAAGGSHTLALVANLGITLQPASAMVNATSNATFSVAAVGSDYLNYQWFKDGAAVTNATNATLSLSNVTTNQAGSYTVVITNRSGSITSSVAVLTVNRLAQVITFGALAPKRTDAAPFTLSATASSGLAVSFVSSNTSIATVSGITVTITGAGTNIITASQAGNATYLPATNISQLLIVGIQPGISSQPTNLTVNVTSNATFNVNATGTAPFSYQWRTNSVNLAGATNATLTLTSVLTNQAGNYAVVITNLWGSITSSVAVLTVNRLGQTITFGGLTNQPVGNPPFTLTATASSGLPVSYTSSNINIATVSGSTVTIVTVTNGSTIITASQAGDATYLPALNVNQTLTVGGTAPAITLQPTSLTVVAPTNVTLSVTASGTGPFTYQWAKNAGDISGATNATLSIGATNRTSSGTYTVRVSNTAGNTTSSNALLRVLVAQHLETPLRLGNGWVRLTFRDAVGTNTPDNLNQLILLSANTLNGTSPLFWATNVTTGFSLTNGYVAVQDTNAASAVQRFYRVMEW